MNFTKPHPGVLLLVCLMGFACLEVIAQPSGLVLWNKLGSTAEVTNSEVGPNLIPNASTAFGAGVFGSALTQESASFGRRNNVIMEDLSMYLNMDRGTIECWYKQNLDPTPHACGIYRIFDGPWRPSDIHSNIRFFSYHDLGDPPAKLYFELYGGAERVTAISLDDGGPGVNISALNGSWIHLAGVWDRSGIEGSSETLRLYIDGVKVASTTVSGWGSDPGPNADIGGSTDGNPIGRYFIDNLKIWDYAKTNFEDRFVEAPVDPPDITCPADVIINCDETDPAALDMATAISHCPTAGLTIDYMDVEDPGDCLHQKVITRTWTARDECGNESSCEQVITVNDNIAPIFTAIPGTVEVPNDPGQCGAVVHYPPISAIDDCEGELSLTVVPESGSFFPAGSSTVTATATDVCGNPREETFEVLVVNDPPVIISITGPEESLTVLETVGMASAYSDNNLQSAVWDWRDGTSTPGIVGAEITGEHIYDEAGMYTITLTLTDMCGETAEEAYEYVEIYDPDGAFVTGSGWINSPSGALVENPAKAGPGNFNFSSRYHVAMGSPEGKAKFSFKKGALDFKSSKLDWLMVAGADVKLKGEGSLKSSGACGFLISAVDGDVLKPKQADKFRIKIWNMLNGGDVIYDNEMGTPDHMAAVTELLRGTVVIHEWKWNSSDAVSAAEISSTHPDPKPFRGDLQVYPNPFQSVLYMDLQTTTEGRISIDVMDVSGRVVDVLYNGYVKAGVMHNFLLNTSDLHPGSYILRVAGQDDEILHRTMVIKH